MASRYILRSSVLLILAIAFTGRSFAKHVHRGPTAPHASEKHGKGHAKPVSQHVIDAARTTEIQSALIKSGYMSGTPSGEWDASTQSAMQKLQADNGWQTKLISDSRAIIKLGLGPAQDSAMSASNATAPHALNSME